MITPTIALTTIVLTLKFDASYDDVNVNFAKTLKTTLMITLTIKLTITLT